MTLALTPIGILTLEIDDHTVLRGTAGGDRLVGVASRYRWEGDRVRATGRGPATDWAVIRPDGAGTVDARMLFETDDGALILVRYGGRISFRPDAATVVIAPTFETNDERYAWLNAVQGIAKGERSGSSLVYELYAAG